MLGILLFMIIMLSKDLLLHESNLFDPLILKDRTFPNPSTTNRNLLPTPINILLGALLGQPNHRLIRLLFLILLHLPKQLHAPNRSLVQIID